MSFLTLTAFAIGAAVPMLIIALLGRTILEKFHYLKSHTTLFRKALGIIIILSVVYMFYLERGINTVPVTYLDNNTNFSLQNGLSNPYLAPSLGMSDPWINSAPLQLKDLKGKVVLIDFWTYSCINCVRTLPYLKGWYNKYHDKGLVIIGVHTPEFDFEKDINNVKNAVTQYNIQYPVLLDSKFTTWQNFKNRYWPAHYLIDKNGYVVYTHFGEGDYEATENNIRYLLNIKKPTETKINNNEDTSELNTPETYLGYARAEHLTSPESVVKDNSSHYTFPQKLTQDDWALQGNWKIMSDRIVSGEANASIKIYFHARNVFVVMGNDNKKTINVKLLLNDKNIITEKGKDIINSSINVNSHTLYEVVTLDKSGDGILQMISSSPGLEIYTFTFG